MTLEIIKEEKFNEAAWYILKLDDMAIQCSRKLEEIEEMYNKIIENPDVMKETWGKWRHPNPNDFLYVHDKLNPVQWRFINKNDTNSTKG